jgi:hypothetical protein
MYRLMKISLLHPLAIARLRYPADAEPCCPGSWSFSWFVDIVLVARVDRRSNIVLEHKISASP